MQKPLPTAKALSSAASDVYKRQAYDKATGQKLADMGSFVGGLTPDKLGDYIGKIFA